MEVAPLSKTRYKWWGYIKAVIRAYPSLKKEYEELHEQSITAKLSSLPGGGEVTRGTEDIAIRELPHTKQREYEAVRRAIDATKRIEGGDRRVMIIDLVYWKNSHTLAGAAMKAGYSYDRAKQMHRDFIVTVAKYYGLMDS
jgi:hypothetical protein